MTVGRGQRFSKSTPCPICGGYDQAPRGQGVRCWGFLAADGTYAHCGREEAAGGLPLDKAGTYAHRLAGDCACGGRHDGGSPSLPAARPSAPARPLAAVPPSRIVATYDYRDEAGTCLYQVVRREPKDFRQRRPDPARPGDWLWSLEGVRRVLFRLPELLAADPASPVYVCEGEKDVLALVALGLVATTSPGGAPQPGQAPKWRAEYAASLAGRDVIVLPDQDAQGRAHAESIAASLVGRARSVKVVALPGLPEHGDVSDWLAAGGTREALEALVAAAPRWSPAPGILPVPLWQAAQGYLDRLAKGPPPAIPTPFPTLSYYLDDGFRPGETVLLGGEAGAGKTAFATEVARYAAARGTGVLVLSREMGLDELSARWLAQAAKVPHRGLRTGRLEPAERSRLAQTLLAADELPLWLDVQTRAVDALAERLAGWPYATPVGLVVVDYLQRLRWPPGITSRTEAYEQTFAALVDLARERSVVMLVLSSLNRPTDKRAKQPTVHRFRGSGELEYDATIALLLACDDPRKETREVECHVAKNRGGRLGVVRLQFQGPTVSFEEPAEEPTLWRR